MARLPLQLAPGIFLGLFDVLLDRKFADSVKVIVNCGATAGFLDFLDGSQPVISSDVVVLNLDPTTSALDAAYKQFHLRFNRVLQNYLSFFYSHNKDASFLINSNYQNAQLAFDSPTMNGVPLKLLFNINRLLKLIKHVSPSVGFVFVAEKFGACHHSNGLLFALAILFLMDSYNYNFEASYRFLQNILPPPLPVYPENGVFAEPAELLNPNLYDDMLLIDSLKKFYVENQKIKQSEARVLTKNIRLKRSVDCLDVAAPAVKRLA